MRHGKMLTLLAIAMLIAVVCARHGFNTPIQKNFTW
jgi:hypothetical protein